MSRRSGSRGRFAPATRTSAGGRPTAFEATPLYVDGTLYVSTPLGRVIALDPVTGRERWVFDARVPRDAGYGDFASRGASTWQRGREGESSLPRSMRV
jgi:quinoprotein glucose dehydrogenase